MLVLSRKAQEKIIIDCNGTKITVTVVYIKGSVVRLGIEAPSHVKVNREEKCHGFESKDSDQPTRKEKAN